MASYGTTLDVAFATTPTVLASFAKHWFQKSKNAKEGKPQAQLRYHEGLVIVRRFLEYASHHSIENLQAFTAMRLPVPNWVRRNTARISDECIERAEAIFIKHLEGYGEGALKEIGGKHWWRQRGRLLEGEWIEMRKDQVRRTAAKVDIAVGQADESTQALNERVILYVHGGAGFFSSLDTHRYQIQRHARKVGGRAFAPAYRLAPQYPFPCGLIDTLATYLYLIDPPADAPHPPIATHNLILSGDSHGAGMVVSMLCILRDEGLPLPAGASLISPWVDLSHSFPSIVGDPSGDYIPHRGFHFEPSLAWPPLRGDGIEVEIDGKQVLLDDQIQMYASNRLLAHPLVSPINQGSLGGLCPLFVVAGSGELLRDEITYLAHKAADPARYPPSPATLSAYPKQREHLERYAQPTKVYLQLYDGVAHVCTTLSFTSPAKHMYRAIANAHIWAYTAAAKAHDRAAKHAARKSKQTPSRQSTVSSTCGAVTLDTSGQPAIDDKAAAAANGEHLDPNDIESEASDDSDADSIATQSDLVSVTGSIPPFISSIIRERVSTKGRIRPLEPESELECLNLPPEHVGAVRSDGPIKTWLATRADWDKRFAKKLEHFRKLKKADRANAVAAHFPQAGGDGTDVPPLTALAGWYDPKHAHEAGKAVDGVPKEQTSSLVSMWVKAGGEADQVRHEKAESHTMALEDKLTDMGIEPDVQEAAADAPVHEIRDHLEAAGSPAIERMDPMRTRVTRDRSDSVLRLRANSLRDRSDSGRSRSNTLRDRAKSISTPGAVAEE